MKHENVARQMKKLFSGLQTYEKADYAALMFIAASMPIAWQLGMWGMIILSIITLWGIFKSRQTALSHISKRQMTGYLLLILFFVVYLLSGWTSENQSYGWHTTTGKLSFLIFPLIFIFGNRQYLDGKRIRSLFYVLWAVIIVRFGIAAIKVALGLVNGVPLSDMMEENFIGIHHSYISLYATVAATFAYSELMQLLKSKKWSAKGWWLLAGCIPLVLTTVMVNSRAGMLFMAILLTIALCDIAVTQKKILQASAILAITLIAGLAIYQVIPQPYKRFTYAINEIRAGRSGDCRPLMIRSGMEVASLKPIFGYGSGDYEEPLQQQFLKNGFQEGYDRKFGSHNQFIETLLECGGIGLAVLVAMLFYPIGILWRKQRRFAITTILAVATALFFESILGRQMGILFVSYLYSLMIFSSQHGLSPETAKRNQNG